MHNVNANAPASIGCSSPPTPPSVGGARPFLKWVGGKRKLLRELTKYLPENIGTFHEPFIGGGALYFNLGHEPSIISDANAKLITAYEAVRDNPDGVIEVLGTFTNTAECYYAVRGRNFSIGSAAQRAAEFIYTNRVGFNGMFRESAAGKFNIPFGRNKNPTICDVENIRAVSRTLDGTTIILLFGDCRAV